MLINKNIAMRNINLECNNFFSMWVLPITLHNNSNAFEYTSYQISFRNLTIKQNYLNMSTSIAQRNFQLKM